MRAVELSTTYSAPNLRIRAYGALCGPCAQGAAAAPTAPVGAPTAPPAAPIAPTRLQRPTALALALAGLAAQGQLPPMPQGLFAARGALPRVRCVDCRFGVPGNECPVGRTHSNAYWRKCKFFIPVTKEKRKCPET